MSRSKARDVLEEGVEMAKEHGTGQIIIAADESEEILDGLEELGLDDGGIVEYLDEELEASPTNKSD